MLVRVNAYSRRGSRVGSYTRSSGVPGLRRRRKPRLGKRPSLNVRDVTQQRVDLPPSVHTLRPGHSSIRRKKSKKRRMNRERSVYDPKRRKKSTGPLTRANAHQPWKD